MRSAGVFITARLQLSPIGIFANLKPTSFSKLITAFFTPGKSWLK
jgi:hypothetical protein